MNDQEFESFRHWTLTSVEEVGRTFTRPDEDWLPVLFLLTPAGASSRASISGSTKTTAARISSSSDCMASSRGHMPPPSRSSK